MLDLPSRKFDDLYASTWHLTFHFHVLGWPLDRQMIRFFDLGFGSFGGFLIRLFQSCYFIG